MTSGVRLFFDVDGMMIRDCDRIGQLVQLKGVGAPSKSPPSGETSGRLLKKFHFKNDLICE